MKCKKCSTPIIPGEKRCRFCGSTMIIEEENNNRQPEIIDIIDEPVNPAVPPVSPIPQDPMHAYFNQTNNVN